MRRLRLGGLAGLFLLLGSSTAFACAVPLTGGALRFGLVPPSERAISAQFGMRVHPVLQFVRMHNGIDYEGSIGEPIRAAAVGVVTMAKYAGEYGNRIEIDHGGGFSTSYSHLSRFASELTRGSCVDVSSVIGFIGNTGLSATPHLHFEATRHGAWLDPELFLK